LLFYSCFCFCLCFFFLLSFLSQDYFGTFNPTSFTSIQNLFQIKSMKVNCSMKDNINKEFEHEDDEELWLIREKNKMKKDMIWCMSIPPFTILSDESIRLRLRASLHS
jgi:hypothetical protein